MRISEIHVYSKHLRIVDGPYTMAGVELYELESTIIKLVSETGLVGWGESCPLGANYQAEHALGTQAAVTLLAENLIGQNCLQPNVLQRFMDQQLTGHNQAKAMIDIACLDLMGKHYDVPVCELLGGARQAQVPSYYALGLGEADEVARLAADKIDQGYKRLQLKIGGRPVSEDIAVIRKVWERVGSKANLIVDANRGLNVPQALAISQACLDLPITFEQPCSTLRENKTLRQQLKHPLFLDENIVDLEAVLTAVSSDLCDGFGIKLTRVGGLSAYTVIRDVCAARNMPLTCDDTFGGGIIAAACVHGGATVSPELMHGVWVATPYIERPYDTKNPVMVRDGLITVPTGPGLGITPDESLFGTPIASFS